MRILKSIPYILVACLAMGIVSFTTMSVAVLRDMAVDEAKEAALIDLIDRQPLRVITNIEIRPSRAAAL